MTTNEIEENVVPQTNNEKKMRSLHNKSIMECCGIRCMGSAAGAYVCVSLSSHFPLTMQVHDENVHEKSERRDR